MKKIFWWGIAIGLSLGMLAAWQWPDDLLHVVACDVGQGDAILITHGFDQVLVDGGPVKGNVIACLGRYLPFWDRQIEMVVATHPDLDHYGGLSGVVSRYRVGLVVVPDLVKNTQQLTAFQEEVWREGVPVVVVASGKKLLLGDMSWKVEWPPQEYHNGSSWTQGAKIDEAKQPRDVNEGSIVMQLQWREFSAWFSGDAHIGVESALLERGGVVHAAYLKVSHHGSKTGSSVAFLEKLKPEIAVMGVGVGNRYGHPHSEVIDRLQKMGVVVQRTDIGGDIEVVSDGNRWWEK